MTDATDLERLLSQVDSAKSLIEELYADSPEAGRLVGLTPYLATTNRASAVASSAALKRLQDDPDLKETPDSAFTDGSVVKEYKVYKEAAELFQTLNGFANGWPRNQVHFRKHHGITDTLPVPEINDADESLYLLSHGQPKAIVVLMKRLVLATNEIITKVDDTVPTRSRWLAKIKSVADIKEAMALDLIEESPQIKTIAGGILNRISKQDWRPRHEALQRHALDIETVNQPLGDDQVFIDRITNATEMWKGFFTTHSEVIGEFKLDGTNPLDQGAQLLEFARGTELKSLLTQGVDRAIGAPGWF